MVHPQAKINCAGEYHSHMSRSTRSGTELPSMSMVQAKICDFGLAMHAATTTASTCTPATKAYTLEYTSPTRLQEFTRSYKDDVYAFGIVMYFIASCESPFHDVDKGEGPQHSPYTPMLTHAHHQLLPLTRPSLPPTPNPASLASEGRPLQ
jgi:serine/threonine protein kinase